MQGEFQILFQAATTDAASSEIERGLKTFNHSLSDEFMRTVVTGRKITLVLSNIRVLCKRGFFGSVCEIECSPRNDSNGHFTCAANGTRLCLPGYQDPSTNCIEVPEVPTHPPLDTLPIIVGGAIGGVVLILIIIIIILGIAICVASYEKPIQRQRTQSGIVSFNT